MTFCYERKHSKATFFYVLKQKKKFDIFRGHKLSRKSLSDFFCGRNFRGFRRNPRNPRKFLSAKVSTSKVLRISKEFLNFPSHERLKPASNKKK